jgi:hypothetical protein
MKRILLLTTVVLLAATLIMAGDFWKQKKYSAWSDKDVQKMLTDSPWAQETFVHMKASAGAGANSGGAMPAGGMGRGGRGGMPARGGMGMPPQMRVTIRWHTALPVKQAVARFLYKEKVETSEEVAKEFARVESTYVVGVSGLPGAPGAYKPEIMKNGAQLIVESAPPIQAMDIKLTQDGMRTNIFFMFPRVQKGGDAISLENKDVEFLLETENIEIKKKFDLKKMVYQGKLEL